jgi:hypothetical protein
VAYGGIDTFWVILRRYLVSPYICHCPFINLDLSYLFDARTLLVDGYWFILKIVSGSPPGSVERLQLRISLLHV